MTGALGAWFAAAFATLSKGLHGLLLPIVIVDLVAVRAPKCRRSLAALAHPLGPVLFLALVLPWPLYVESQFSLQIPRWTISPFRLANQAQWIRKLTRLHHLHSLLNARMLVEKD
jgi:4-amino-4-deoxy-L-arabinose transferase-like glycosyltransferase